MKVISFLLVLQWQNFMENTRQKIYLEITGGKDDIIPIARHAADLRGGIASFVAAPIYQ